MTAVTAIYARKSVYREDSISVESQIEMCLYEARGETHTVYTDNGYSGKNTERPGFRRMMDDIRAGRINKVIVYKLDRISRSVLDFSGMIEVFRRHGVDFVSATEHFDTSSPMGRAMLNICIVFAQLERETIQQRIIDAYASRSRKGFYMGGRIPYGYRRVPVTIDGVKTSMYEQIPEEAADIRTIYELYSRPAATLGDVLRELRSRGRAQNLRGKIWSAARLSELIRNPAYTFADPAMYSFFTEQKSNIIDPPEDYRGVTSMYLFRGENTNRKTWDLSGQNVVIAPHTGIVSSEIWLICRRKLLGNHRTVMCKAKNSFLSGRIRCGFCGSAMHVILSDRRADGTRTRYFRCGGHLRKRSCTAEFPTLYAAETERLFVEELRKKIGSMDILPHDEREREISAEVMRLKAQATDIARQIDRLISSIPESEPAAAVHISRKISELDRERKRICGELERHERERKTPPAGMTNAMDKWEQLSFDEKRAVTGLITERIEMYTDCMKIIWSC